MPKHDNEAARSLPCNAGLGTVELARILMMHAVSNMMDGCGNSYANAYTEQWLTHAKSLGAYHGKVIGNITQLQIDWEDWLDENGGLPEWPNDLKISDTQGLAQPPALAGDVTSPECSLHRMVRRGGECLESPGVEASALLLAVDNVLKISRCARLSIHIAGLKLRLMRRRLLGELRFQILEMVVRFCKPLVQPVAVNEQRHGDSEQNGTTEPDGNRNHRREENGIAGGLDARQQDRAGAEDNGGDDSSGCIVPDGCDVASDVHLGKSPNDLKISDAEGMAQDLRDESEWKVSNFMGSVNTQEQVL